jgi:hypothetical protein
MHSTRTRGLVVVLAVVTATVGLATTSVLDGADAEQEAPAEKPEAFAAAGRQAPPELAGANLRFAQSPARNLPADDVHNGFVNCPLGFHAVAGGGHTDRAELFITDSFPGPPRRWNIRWESDNDTVVDPSAVNTYALCARA